MARFNQPRYDDRGPEYDRRYGRFEQAYARHWARERYRMENRHGRGQWESRRPDPRGDFPMYDRDYSRRHWPPAQRDRRYWY